MPLFGHADRQAGVHHAMPVADHFRIDSIALAHRVAGAVGEQRGLRLVVTQRRASRELVAETTANEKVFLVGIGNRIEHRQEGIVRLQKVPRVRIAEGTNLVGLPGAQ